MQYLDLLLQQLRLLTELIQLTAAHLAGSVHNLDSKRRKRPSASNNTSTQNTPIQSISQHCQSNKITAARKTPPAREQTTNVSVWMHCGIRGKRTDPNDTSSAGGQPFKSLKQAGRAQAQVEKKWRRYVRHYVTFFGSLFQPAHGERQSGIGMACCCILQLQQLHAPCRKITQKNTTRYNHRVCTKSKARQDWLSPCLGFGQKSGPGLDGVPAADEHPDDQRVLLLVFVPRTK